MFSIKHSPDIMVTDNYDYDVIIYKSLDDVSMFRLTSIDFI